LKTSWNNKVALTGSPVHTRKRVCKGRPSGAGSGVGPTRCGQACCAGENAVAFQCWCECRRARGERASGASMRCGRGALDSPLALIAGGLAVGALRPRLLDTPRHAWAPREQEYCLQPACPGMHCTLLVGSGTPPATSGTVRSDRDCCNSPAATTQCAFYA